MFHRFFQMQTPPSPATSGRASCSPPKSDKSRAPLDFKRIAKALGGLRALAVTTTTRSEALADVPTVAEFLPGFEASSWYGMGAPKNTPAEIVEKLNKEVNAGLADAAMKARFVALAGIAIAGSPADFGKLIANETEKWGKVVRAANIKAIPLAERRGQPERRAACHMSTRSSARITVPRRCNRWRGASGHERR
jgi:hypothetical protein